MSLIHALGQILAMLGFHHDTTGFLLLFGLGFARIAAAIALTPFLGSKAVSGRIKVGLAAVVMAILYPAVSAGQQVSSDSLQFIALMVKEVIVGAVLGYISQLVFFAVQMAGALIDNQRGMNQASFVAPQLPGNVSLLGQAKLQAAIALFVTMNGHLVFIRALADSFNRLPIGTFPRFPSGLPAMSEQIVRITADMVAAGVQLSAPVLVALFLVDVAFGALAKVAGPINVHAESQPVKSFAGLAVFLLSVGFVFDRLQHFFTVMIHALYDVMRGFA